MNSKAVLEVSVKFVGYVYKAEILKKFPDSKGMTVQGLEKN